MPIKNIYGEEKNISKEDKCIIWDFYNYLLEVRKATENTANNYELDIRHFAEYLCSFTNLHLTVVQQKDVENYMLWMESKEISKSTIQRTQMSLSVLYTYLYNVGKIQEPIVIKKGSRLYVKVKDRKLKENVLSLEEINLIEKEPTAHFSYMNCRDRAIVLLLLSTGIKNNEIVRLKIGDFAPDKRVIICGEHKHQREIQLTKEVSFALQQYIDKARPLITSSNEKEEIMFLVLKTGEPISRWGLIKLVCEYCQKLGINRKVTPELLRDTFIANSYKRGVQKEELSRVLGISPETFKQFYVHKHT